MQRIEVVTGEQMRRRYTAEEKSRFVTLSMQLGHSVSLVARQYGIIPACFLINALRRHRPEGLAPPRAASWGILRTPSQQAPC